MRRVAILVGREPAERYSLHRGYPDALWAAGAVPLVLVPPQSRHDVDRYVAAATACDAIVVTGGGDVEPHRYGAAPAGELMEVDAFRDQAEIAAVAAATREGVPVLGICRGIQVIAVALGGTLCQDLPAAGFVGHWELEREAEAVHDVRATPGSLAFAALGGSTATNSIHHQAVATTGPALVATAWSTDGVIEAVEAPGILGVQWHPERLVASDPRHLAPFRWIATAASATAGSPAGPQVGR